MLCGVAAVAVIFFSLVYHASKGSIFQNLFIFTVANVMPCDGRKKFPVLHYNADYIFWSFGIIGFIFGYFENRIMLKHVLGDVASVVAVKSLPALIYSADYILLLVL